MKLSSEMTVSFCYYLNLKVMKMSPAVKLVTSQFKYGKNFAYLQHLVATVFYKMLFFT
jgi:hypothetical protein